MQDFGRQIKPAKDWVRRYGVKAIVFGPPGTGKTPIVQTAPSPLLVAHEPGLLTMRKSNVPTIVVDTAQEIRDFYKWFFNSAESKKYDTLAADSISQAAEIILADELPKHKNKLQAYGVMALDVMNILQGLFFMENKHTYLIAKQENRSEKNDKARPYFPGKEVNIRAPHLYDEILNLDTHANVPGFGEPIKAFMCHEQFAVAARDRSGALDLFEPPDFGHIVRKAMA